MTIKSAFLLLSAAFGLLISCENPSKLTHEVEAEVHIPQPLYAYGINIDSLQLTTARVKKNEFLADILLKYHIDYSTIDFIARNTKDVFDVRKLRRGNTYCLISSMDSMVSPQYFVYEIDATDYVIYHLTDSIFARRGKKEVWVEAAQTSGTIESSLWNALIEQETDANLANELSEIYAWTIDFFGLQKGDSFKVYYDKKYVDSTYIGLGRVKAAQFHHAGSDQYAFLFQQDSALDYFDDSGKSLQRTFLKAPLRFTRISSKFSHSRMHPVLKIRRPHHGIDYAAPSGTPVYTVGDGVVIKRGYQKSGGGNYITIKHNGTYSTTYMHLSGYAKGMQVGKHVKQGDLIGYVGKTGLATGPHLDFRFYRNGKAMDPLKVESPPSKPIDSMYQSAFDSVVKQYMLILDSIH